jgi:predicted O-linked N-acetylglucosamine transferase (SPINDLY family)
LHALIDNPGIHKKCSALFSEHKAPKSTVLPSITPYPHHTTVRIGYFSPDFKNHPVASLTAGLFENHDRATFEIHAFSFGPDTKDTLNLRIKAGVDHFHDVRTLSDKEVALLARSLELDIAVDLAGFTKGHRTGIFAMSAAPVQLSYVGFAGTMGADYYDYLIADSTLIPEEHKDYYTENIVYLPSYQVNSSQNDFQEILRDKAHFGIPEEAFVFCCFNNTSKITPDAFDERAIKNLQQQIEVRGIDPSRLIFGDRLTGSDYWARYQAVDLFLDTFPCNGGATLSDALRMGCPILTCMGDSFSSRMGASLLTALDMPELITTTQTQYEEMAVDFAANPKRLKALREKLKSNIHTTPLYDTEQFTRSLEAAYLVMYDRCQSKQDLDDIYV